MKRSLRWALVALLISVLLIVFHEPISHFLAKYLSSKDEGASLAEVIEVEGQARIRTHLELTDSEAHRGDSLYNMTSLSTGPDGKVQVGFSNQTVIAVEPDSLMVIEALNEEGRPPLMITFLRGNYKIQRPGNEGQLALSIEGHVIDPAGRDQPAEPLKLATGDLKNNTATESQAQITPTPETGASAEDTLPDDYIQNVVKSQKPFFNRCYAEFLQNHLDSKGALNFSFKILGKGEVTEVRYLGGDIQDKRLQRCAMAVLERCRFKSFKGAAIVVNYPIQFE